MLRDPTLKLFREARAQSGTGRAPLGVDPEAVHLWRRAKRLIAAGRVNPRASPQTWSEEYRQIRSALRRILHRKAWQANPLDPPLDEGLNPPNAQWDAAGAAAIAAQLDAAVAS
jgi:hypothetical protein